VRVIAANTLVNIERTIRELSGSISAAPPRIPLPREPLQRKKERKKERMKMRFV